MKKLATLLVVFALLLTSGVAIALDGSVTPTTTWVSGQKFKVVKYHWVASTLSVTPYANLESLNGFFKRYLIIFQLTYYCFKLQKSFFKRHFFNFFFHFT